MSSFLGSAAMWYFVRASGIVALILLTATVALGILTANRWTALQLPQFFMGAIHRNLSLLAVTFLGLHVVSSVVDTYVSIPPAAAFVPFTASVQPVALGLGAVAFDLVLALVLTSLVRVRLGLRAWRLVHWLGYLAWPVAFVHGIAMGTDRGTGWGVIVSAACLFVVSAAAYWRLLLGLAESGEART
jgi:sulfoxide reductase heme-binding subunit YedZ